MNNHPLLNEQTLLICDEFLAEVWISSIIELILLNLLTTTLLQACHLLALPLRYFRKCNKIFNHKYDDVQIVLKCKKSCILSPYNLGALEIKLL